MIDYVKIDLSDATKSIAIVKVGDIPVKVEYWNSINIQCQNYLENFLFAEANIKLGNIDEAISILTPIATGEDTTFFEQTVDTDGKPFTNFGGADTRNWAQKRIDELN
jgi:hypothetical protein